jgi:hypothetical protein
MSQKIGLLCRYVPNRSTPRIRDSNEGEYVLCYLVQLMGQLKGWR